MNNIPSHQLIVEVTGAQYPSFGRAGGYGKWGRPKAMVKDGVIERHV